MHSRTDADPPQRNRCAPLQKNRRPTSRLVRMSELVYESEIISWKQG